jgi:UDP-N-acetylmuramoyl-tripeptide--D-alanyl-D-alanine ligase
MGWTSKEVVEATGAKEENGHDGWFEAVSTDSRHVPLGALFVALRGERHDGHAYAAEAMRKGASGVVAETFPPGVEPRQVFLVLDTLRALGDLAAYTRRREPLRVIAITGSNGKTTTKEMVASICERSTFPPPSGGVLKTQGNLNNLIGLPLTLLRLTGGEAVAVLEMGMNATGEIARLTEIAAPDVGVVTNVGPAHLEGLGSIAGVAAAKGELFANISPQGIIAVNMEDEWVVRIASGFRGRRVEFRRGREVEARSVRDLGLDGLELDLHVAGKSRLVRLSMPGAHNVSNALAAAAVTYALGVGLDTICDGLEEARLPKMRMQVERLANGVTLINDAYNANPASMAAALRAVTARPGRAIAVLGEMRELGDESNALHRDIGRLAVEVGIAVLIAVGPGSDAIIEGARAAGRSSTEIHSCPDAATAATLVTSLWKEGDVILAKGSRGGDDEEAVRKYGARMAEVVARLADAGGRP